MTRPIIFAILSFCAVEAGANSPADIRRDSATAQTALHADTARNKKNFMQKLRNYFNSSNKIDNSKKFDVGILGGPHYSTDTGFGIGIVGTGRYRQDRSDTLSPPSDVALFGDVTTKKSYTVGIRGTHIFPQDRGRIEYTLAVNSFEAKYWGIGYEMGNNDANESKMKRWKILAKASVMWEVGHNFFIGPAFTYDYVYAHEMTRPELLLGMDNQTWNIGGGLTIAYDSRDVLTKPTKGVYLNVTQLFRPRFLCNGYDFITTDFRFNAYGRLWHRAVIAGDVRGTLNFGDPSWGMMSMIGNSFSMRGYYEGRYRDKHKIEAQVELRQDFWKRCGVAIWGGAGTVFNKFSAMRFDRLLPNWGLGFRWEFKKNSNIRLDYGFGKSGISGFVFNINEAF